MPEHVVSCMADVLNVFKKPINGCRILVLGLAYKANVDDGRESPCHVLMGLLKERGADVVYYDSYVSVIRQKREHPQWEGTRSIEWGIGLISPFDCVLIATAHACVDYRQLADWAQFIVDTSKVMPFAVGSSRHAKARRRDAEFLMVNAEAPDEPPALMK